MKQVKYFIGYIFLALLLCFCKGKEKPIESFNSDSTVAKTVKAPTKPGSSFTDTILVNGESAIFFYPDSIQDAKIKAITAENIYKSFVHEMFYQMRNSKIVIQKTYPHLKMVEMHKARYALVKKKDGGQQIIDLNQYNDSRGMIMVNGIKAPQLTDMTNIETELFRYFKEK